MKRFLCAVLAALTLLPAGSALATAKHHHRARKKAINNSHVIGDCRPNVLLPC